MTVDMLNKPVIVQKFGGTTISGPSVLPQIEDVIRQRIESGFKVVVVVSAMGRGPSTGNKLGDPYATDTLLSLLPEATEHICLREKDLMMMCGEIISAVTLSCHLRQSGITSRARTGFEAGIITDNNSTNAKIKAVIPSRLFQDLRLMDVVVVAGFQGISLDGRITTLGRGGSDTTAIALGYALEAKQIEIYTDQKGIYSADPREVPKAMHLNILNARDIIHMSWAGAKVLHPRAAELIAKYKLNVSIGHLENQDKATIIELGEGFEVSSPVTAIAHSQDVTQFSVLRNLDRDQSRMLDIFTTVTKASASMDMFTITDKLVRFTVSMEKTTLVSESLEQRGYTLETRYPCRKVSIVGAGMHGLSGVMARFAKVLISSGIEILQTVDSHATISALVSSENARLAQQVLHDEFIRIKNL
ncbi:aspartate kinase [bacterium]|nr:aspartate kinase [bacterium]